jgi:hypothetical protein
MRSEENFLKQLKALEVLHLFSWSTSGTGPRFMQCCVGWEKNIIILHAGIGANTQCRSQFVWIPYSHRSLITKNKYENHEKKT